MELELNVHLCRPVDVERREEAELVGWIVEQDRQLRDGADTADLVRAGLRELAP